VATIRTSKSRPPSPRRQTRVVLIDDEARRQYVTAEVLRSEGYEVLSRAGHEGVMELFRSSLSEPAAWVSFATSLRPDVVVIDLRTRDALVTIGALIRHQLTCHLPVVAIAHSGQAVEMRAARALGAAKTLAWPMVPSPAQSDDCFGGLGRYIDAVVTLDAL
jgi:CheY-like chemotaxis protein